LRINRIHNGRAAFTFDKHPQEAAEKFTEILQKDQKDRFIGWTHDTACWGSFSGGGFDKSGRTAQKTRSAVIFSQTTAVQKLKATMITRR
jgi:hypothetical protein